MGLLVSLFAMFYCRSTMLARLVGMFFGFIVVASFMMGGRGMVMFGGLVMSLRRIGVML